jgi:hypothetical protein
MERITAAGLGISTDRERVWLVNLIWVLMILLIYSVQILFRMIW